MILISISVHNMADILIIVYRHNVVHKRIEFLSILPNEVVIGIKSITLQ
jgi:hypothetical protein